MKWLKDNLRKGLVKRMNNLIECEEDDKNLKIYQNFLDSIIYHQGEKARDNKRSMRKNGIINR